MDVSEKLKELTAFQHWLGSNYKTLPTDSLKLTRRARLYYAHELGENKKYTLKDLADGKVALINDGTKEQIEKVLKKAFPQDQQLLSDSDYSDNADFFFKDNNFYVYWTFGNVTELPKQSVNTFLDEIYHDGIFGEEKESETITDGNYFPKIMLVSEYPISDNSEGLKRVVFAKKNGVFLAWKKAETFEEAEKANLNAAWKYAKEIGAEENEKDEILKFLSTTNIVPKHSDSMLPNGDLKIGFKGKSDVPVRLTELLKDYKNTFLKMKLVEISSEIFCEDGNLKGKSPSELIKWINKNLKK